jgi:peroxiredoxin
MVSSYRSVKTYVDRGTVTSTTDGETETKTFTTAFERSSRKLRFAFRMQGATDDAFVVWVDAAGPHTAAFVKPGVVETEDNADVSEALGAIAGVSSLVSQLAPSLLADDKPLFAQMRGAKTMATETVDGHACWRVTASLGDVPITVWLDQQRHVLRRVEVRLSAKRDDGTALTMVQTIELTPRLDEPIAASELVGVSSQIKSVVKEAPRWLGVLFDNNSSKIRDVLPDSPALKAGVKRGDVVVTLGGVSVSNAGDVIAKVQQHRAGEKLEIVLERGGKRMTLTATLEKRPELTQLQQTSLMDKPAPAFELATLDGKRVKLADLKGKVVLVDFWASWCKPCLASMPALVELHRTLTSKGLVIVGVTDDDPADAKQTVADKKLTYPIALDPDHAAWSAYLVQGLPTTVLIDRTGIVRQVMLGASGYGDEQVKAMIEKLLK